VPRQDAQDRPSHPKLSWEDHTMAWSGQPEERWHAAGCRNIKDQHIGMTDEDIFPETMG